MVITVFSSSFICGFICFKLGARWQRQQNANVGTPSASHNKPMAGAEPPQITPCPCEKDIACMNGSVGMEDCPKYVKTA
jgi:hypothetical protein